MPKETPIDMPTLEKIIDDLVYISQRQHNAQLNRYIEFLKEKALDDGTETSKTKDFIKD